MSDEDRLDEIRAAWADLKAHLADGGRGTHYLRDNDSSRQALNNLMAAIEDGGGR